ncbi:MAG: helix-turn-helix transcriptional regulator [Kiritimatiellia bacterium]|nr:helix-turn-helix transcriptional regulator [Kiritimatiellia bacterium]
MTTSEIGQKIKITRKRQGLTQPTLAMVAGTGLRFIVDLEAGKNTCQIGKVLQVLSALGMNIAISDGFVQ